MRESMHELILNGLPLSGLAADALTSGGYAISVLAEGFEPGSHEAVLSVVRTIGADGSSVREEGADNAETTFRVMIEGVHHAALAEGRAALQRAFPMRTAAVGADASVELVYRPSDGLAPAAVRDVVHGAARHEYDDLDEISDPPRRIYAVTLTHLPYVRSEYETTAPALSVGEVTETVVVDTCDSAAGWSSDHGAVTASGGTVYAGRSWSGPVVAPDPYTLTMTRAGAVPMSSTPYLLVEAQAATLLPAAPATVSLVTDDGTALPPIRSQRLAGDYIQHAFDTTGHTLSAVRVQAASTRASRDDALFLRIASVARTSNPSGTARQQMRTLSIGGTERTPGSIHVAQRTGAAPLGPTLIHTSPHEPGGYDPDLLRWATAPGVPDPTVPAGKTWDLSAADVITFSPSSTYPQGPYVLYAYVRSTTTQSVRFSRTVAGSIPGGTTFREIHQRSEYVTLTAGKWTMVSIGLESLPAMRGPLGNTWVVIGCNGAPGVTIGGFWAFAAGDSCSLTIVDAEQPHLYIDSPKVGEAADVWCSAVADRSNGYYPSGGVVAAGLPVLSAGLTDVYVVTADADNPEIDCTHFRRWPDWPADDGTTP